VGTVDLLVADPRHDVEAVADSLIEEVLRSARNKGCVTVEVTRSNDPAEQARWSRRGFSDAGMLLARPVATGRVASRTS
jgi:ribosomal protein S18 acetylase RimI-like enzyme